MIEIGYKNGEKILVKLFDNSISKKLIDTYSNSPTDAYEQISAYTLFDNNYDNHKQNSDTISKHWGEILEGLNGMKELGNEINKQFPNEFDFSQETLNVLHRIFTYVDLYHFNEISEYPYCDNYSHPTNISWEHYHSIVNKINSGVHSLESWVKPTDNLIFAQENFDLPRILYCVKNYSTFKMNWCEFDNEEYKQNFNFLSYDKSNLVILRETILGKSPLTSFINNDNPNLPDCTGRFATDGSLSILLDDDLQKLYNSDNFNSWCSSYGKTPSDFPLEFAIGYVEDSSNELRYFLDKELELESIKWI